MSAEKKNMYVVSYIPFLRNYDQQTSSESMPTDIIDRIKDVSVDACLWAIEDDLPVAIFAVERAKELCDHILWWCHGDVSNWFKCVVGEDNNRYVVALHPTIEMSVQRIKLAASMKDSDFNPDDYNYHVLYRPIAFSSKDCGTSNYQKIKSWLKKELIVKLVEIDILRAWDGSNNDMLEDNIYTIGKVDVAFDGYQQWISKFLSDVCISDLEKYKTLN